jgi:nicotinamidase-related amidase
MSKNVLGRDQIGEPLIFMADQTTNNPLRLSNTILSLVVVDIQEKFRPAVPLFDTIAANSEILIRAFKTLSIPIVATEQYPKGLGPTVEPVASALGQMIKPLEKKMFSCLGADGFVQQLDQYEINTVCICGIETHVCVYQTVLDLLEKGMNVVLAADACGSRKELDHSTAIRRMEACGAIVMTVEMILFDLLGSAENKFFKEVQRLVK